MATPNSTPSFTIDHGMVDGQTIAQWTADWWTWALQADAKTNPLLDSTGAFANVNNGGPVYFIGGTENGTAERTFAAPAAGKPILFPMLNFFDTLDPKNTENQLMAAFKNSVTNIFAEIDGVSIINPQSHLERTDFFSMGQTKEGSLIAQLGAPVGSELSPTKSTGYWLMIEGLSPGSHTLHFGGSSSGIPDVIAPFSVDVTDHITIVSS
jgi:hypothetical protein